MPQEQGRVTPAAATSPQPAQTRSGRSLLPTNAKLHQEIPEIFPVTFLPLKL